MIQADDVIAPGTLDPDDLDVAALAYADRRETVSAREQADLRERLIRDCLPFAGRLARRYRGRGEPLEDLEQVAGLGLVKAIDRYRPERGSFTAYAFITMSGELKRHFRDRTWRVHVPRPLQNLSLEVRRAAEELTISLSRQPTTADIAGRLGIGEDAVAEALRTSASHLPRSLNMPSPGGGEVGDLLGHPDADLEVVDDKMTVAPLLWRLPARERRMLALRFYGDLTQREIAEAMGISQMHVSRLLSRALGWLREAMLSDHPPRWRGADPDELRVRVDRHDTVITVRVCGEVERDTAANLRIHLNGAMACATAERVVVDLSGVSLLDAAGIAVIHEAAHTCDSRGVELSIAGARPYVARVLAISGMAGLLAGGNPCRPVTAPTGRR